MTLNPLAPARLGLQEGDIQVQRDQLLILGNKPIAAATKLAKLALNSDSPTPLGVQKPITV